MKISRIAPLFVLVPVLAACRSAESAAPATRVEGRIRAPDGAAPAGASVTLRRIGGTIATTVTTGSDGAFAFPELDAGAWHLEARARGHAVLRDTVQLPAGAPLDLTLPAGAARATSAELLAALPEGEAKRRFKLDCNGCHTYSRLIERSPNRTREDWAHWVGVMLSFAGADKGFPIMSAKREAEATAAWLARHARPAPPADLARPAAAVHGRSVIREYDLPEAGDLAHDLVIDGRGHVIVTGMFTSQLYDVDPAKGAVARVPIPVPNANPRAVDIDASGDWWVLLGGPRRAARYRPATGEWQVHDIGMYPHDLVIGADGGIWYNGHFTAAPERVGRLDPATGRAEDIEVATPPNPDGGSNIPYGLRQAPDGLFWGTQLAGNRLVRYDARTGAWRSWEMPTPHAGPRRLDVGRDGTVWIPEFAAGRLARFDPATEKFTEYDYPTPDALPYIARVDPRSGAVWVATGASNTIGRFDPRRGRFTEYVLPYAEALVRHIAIARDGSVWGAYSPSPSDMPARLFHLTPLD